MLQSFHMPIFRGLEGFRADWLRSDIPAGLSIAAVGLPSAIAYPAIAGLPRKPGYMRVSSRPLPTLCSGRRGYWWSGRTPGPWRFSRRS